MKLDLYHKVLSKLYEVTGGKESQIIDLKDLVKTQGFLGSYHDIFQFLSVQGWIMETAKADYVKITHWGVKEAKRSLISEPESGGNIQIEAAALVRKVKEFSITAGEFAEDISEEKFKQVEKNLDELKMIVVSIKSQI